MRLEKISLENYFNPNNLVTSHEIFTRKNEIINSDGEVTEQKKFAEDSLFSKRIFGDMDSEEEFSCECGKLKGKFYEGRICDKCETPVKFVGLNINKYGWIDLSLSKYQDNVLVEKGKGFHILKFIAYSMLEKVIGRENLKNIIHRRGTITIKGDIDEKELEKIRAESPKNKYWFLGLENFFEQYNEILEYYFELSGKKNEDLFNFLKNKNESFIEKIPVVSIILRPAMRTADGLKLDGLNIRYHNILKNIEILKDTDLIPLIRSATIEQIQAEYFQLSEEIMDNIKSKSGLIRNQICGTRINFSARNIISPGSYGLKINEIALPYLTFIELYRFEIINIIKEIENITFKEAENRWFNAKLNFDEKIYLIMKKMIKENEVAILLNRNPTISYGSILYLQVAEIKKDYNDMTASLHNSILSFLSGDYDGDVLNIISLKESIMRETFKEVFSPIKLIIDPNNGKFNNTVNLERDQILGLNNLIS